MKYTIIILCTLLSFTVQAQRSNVIIYAEEGENFTLYINGKKFNEEPQSRVAAKDLSMEFAQIKIEFDIPGAPILKSPLMLERGMEHTAMIRKNKKGKYVLRMVSFDEIPEEPEETNRVRLVEATQPDPGPEPTQTTKTTTSTTTSGGGDDDNSETFGFNVSVGGETVSMNVSLGGGEDVVTTQTTVTTSETVTTQNSNTSTSTTEPESINTCKAMSSPDYGRARSSIENKAFPDAQLTVFKQIIRANCVSVDQVIGFMELFTYEEEKLEVAKVAYPKTSNKGSYYQVNDAFTYPDSIEELESFLSKQ